MATSATKSIKVSSMAHRSLNMLSAETGAHVYEIVDRLVGTDKRESYLTALRHGAHRNHDYSPASCNGCELIERMIGIQLSPTKNGSRTKGGK